MACVLLTLLYYDKQITAENAFWSGGWGLLGSFVLATKRKITTNLREATSIHILGSPQ